MLMDRFAEIQERERTYAAESASAGAARLARDGVDTSSTVRDGDPTGEILAEARDWAADLLVLGSRGLTGLDRFLLGSVARNVAKHAGRPVLIARAPGAGIKRAVLATDGSENSRDALQFAGALPLPEDCTLTIVHVTKPYDPFPGILPTDREAFEAHTEKVRAHRQGAADRLVVAARLELVEAGKVVDTAVRTGDPAGEILALAEELHADLIIVGARGVSPLAGLFVGSVADRLLNGATCSLLIVHPRD